MVDVDVEGMQRVRLNDIPYPLAIPRFITITCLLFHACRTGIPAIAEPGSKAIGLVVHSSRSSFNLQIVKRERMEKRPGRVHCLAVGGEVQLTQR